MHTVLHELQTQLTDFIREGGQSYGSDSTQCNECGEFPFADYAAKSTQTISRQEHRPNRQEP